MKNSTLTLLLLTVICLFTLNKATAQQYPGYTLYSVMNSTATQLIDTNGTVYHSWTHTTANKTGYSCYLMPGGILWRSVSLTGTSLTGGGMTGKVQKVDYAGTILWDYTYSSSTYCIHHDICPLPNGNVLLISYDVKTPTQATAAGASSSLTVWSEKIIEVQPTGATTGTIVWQWNLWDHLVQNVNASGANYQTSIVDHPELMNINYGLQKDWFHMNGIDYNPVLDQIALSAHNKNMWMIIDHSTTTAEAAGHTGGLAGKGGDFLYRYGNPASYGATGSSVLNVTHDSHWIPEGVPNAGRLVGFNNKGVSSTQSAVDQIDLPLVSGTYNYSIVLGSAYTPTTFTQRHACSGYSSNMSCSEQFPNGNMLVCMATLGTMYEINAAGTTLWTTTASGMVPQAHHYTDCFINNAQPPIPTITESAGTLTSSTATTYQWYLNGVQIAGATNQNYTPTASGVYLVKTTDVNGCVYTYSLSYIYTMTPTGVSETMLANEMTIYPNPSTGIVNIDNSNLQGESYEVSVYDTFGKLIAKEKNATSVDFSLLENGIYFITIYSPTIGSVNKKVIIQK